MSLIQIEIWETPLLLIKRLQILKQVKFVLHTLGMFAAVGVA